MVILKNGIKHVVSGNVRLNDLVYRSLTKGETERHLREVTSLSSDDSIADVATLSIFAKRAKNGSRFYTRDPNVSNSLIYGIARALFGHMDGGNLLEMPAVEHGLILDRQYFRDSDTTARMACCTLGDYRWNAFRAYRQIPVFRVGPYIRYADDFYSEKNLSEWKSKLGRTLLVFPGHSTDQSDMLSEDNLLFTKVSRIATKYDSVLFCVFWWDLDREYVRRARSLGYHVCSAGFRNDPMFLPRLKTIIGACDLAVGNSFGTHIGYCLECGVGYRHLSTNHDLVLKHKRGRYVRSSHRDMECNVLSILSTEIDVADLRMMLDPFWGFSWARTSNDLEAIKNISRDLTACCRGWRFRVGTCARYLLERYREEDDAKYRILLEACGEEPKQSTSASPIM